MKKIFFTLLAVLFLSPVLAKKPKEVIEIQSHIVNIPVSVTFEGNKIDVYGATNIKGKVFITITGKPVTYVLNMKQSNGLLWVNKKTDTKITIPSFYIVATQDELPAEKKLRELNLYFDKFRPKGINSYLWLVVLKLKRKQGSYLINGNTIKKQGDNLLFKTTFNLPNNVEIGDYKIRAFVLKPNGDFIKANNQTVSIKRAGIIDAIYKNARDHPYLYAYLVILLSLLIGFASGYSRRP